MSKLTSTDELSTDTFRHVSKEQYTDFVDTMIDMYTVNGLFYWIGIPSISSMSDYNYDLACHKAGPFNYPFKYVDDQEDVNQRRKNALGVLLAWKSLKTHGYGSYLREAMNTELSNSALALYDELSSAISAEFAAPLTYSDSNDVNGELQWYDGRSPCLDLDKPIFRNIFDPFPSNTARSVYENAQNNLIIQTICPYLTKNNWTFYSPLQHSIELEDSKLVNFDGIEENLTSADWCQNLKLCFGDNYNKAMNINVLDGIDNLRDYAYSWPDLTATDFFTYYGRAFLYPFFEIGQWLFDVELPQPDINFNDSFQDIAEITQTFDYNAYPNMRMQLPYTEALKPRTTYAENIGEYDWTTTFKYKNILYWNDTYNRWWSKTISDPEFNHFSQIRRSPILFYNQYVATAKSYKALLCKKDSVGKTQRFAIDNNFKWHTENRKIHKTYGIRYYTTGELLPDMSTLSVHTFSEIISSDIINQSVGATNNFNISREYQPYQGLDQNSIDGTVEDILRNKFYIHTNTGISSISGLTETEQEIADNFFPETNSELENELTACVQTYDDLISPISAELSEYKNELTNLESQMDARVNEIKIEAISYFLPDKPTAEEIEELQQVWDVDFENWLLDTYGYQGSYIWTRFSNNLARDQIMISYRDERDKLLQTIEDTENQINDLTHQFLEEYNQIINNAILSGDLTPPDQDLINDYLDACCERQINITSEDGTKAESFAEILICCDIELPSVTSLSGASDFKLIPVDSNPEKNYQWPLPELMMGYGSETTYKDAPDQFVNFTAQSFTFEKAKFKHYDPTVEDQQLCSYVDSNILAVPVSSSIDPNLAVIWPYDSYRQTLHNKLSALAEKFEIDYSSYEKFADERIDYNKLQSFAVNETEIKDLPNGPSKQPKPRFVVGDEPLRNPNNTLKTCMYNGKRCYVYPIIVWIGNTLLYQTDTLTIAESSDHQINNVSWSIPVSTPNLPTVLEIRPWIKNMKLEIDTYQKRLNRVELNLPSRDDSDNG